MSIWSAIGGIFDPNGQAAANRAGDALNNALVPGSPYWQAGQLTDDAGIQAGAAELGTSPVGLNTSNLDADTAAYGGLGALYSGIAQNGGALTKAVGAQAAADLANMGTAKLRSGSEQEAGTVLAQDQAERNWAAAGANQSRAQQLATQLQKQVWNTAVSHANFEAALAGKGLQNQDRNAAFDLANGMATAGQSARNSGTTLDRELQGQDFKNTMAAVQALGALGGQAASTLTSMAASPYSPAGVANSTGTTSGAQTYDTGYAVPQASLGTTFNAGGVSKAASPVAAPTVSNYVNPITGNTVDMNMPTEASAWGDWIVDGSSLASV